MTATTTSKKKAPTRPKQDDYLTDGVELVQVRRVMEDYAMVDNVRSPVGAPDLLCLSWERIAESWRPVAAS